MPEADDQREIAEMTEPKPQTIVAHCGIVAQIPVKKCDERLVLRLIASTAWFGLLLPAF